MSPLIQVTGIAFIEEVTLSRVLKMSAEPERKQYETYKTGGGGQLREWLSLIGALLT